MPDINMQVFGEARRNQLVTEIDIQTQVALDDYQVQLSDIANPTQSQDNVVIDRFGEFLPHWNESLDFDTWVKMSMEIAGKKLLMIRGNDGLSSASNGSDVFVGFFDGDSTGWTKVDPNSHISFTNNRLEFTNLNRNENAYVYKNITGLDAFEYTFSTQITSQVSAFAILYPGINDAISTLGQAINSIYISRDKVQAYTTKRVSSSGTAGEFITSDETAIIYYKGTLLNDVWTVKAYSDAEMTNQISVTSDISVSDLTLTDLDYLYILSSTNTGNAEYYASGWIDDFKLRKYTATEPTYIISIPKNIVTALKSLGRVG